MESEDLPFLERSSGIVGVALAVRSPALCGLACPVALRGVRRGLLSRADAHAMCRTACLRGGGACRRSHPVRLGVSLQAWHAVPSGT